MMAFCLLLSCLLFLLICGTAAAAADVLTDDIIAGYKDAFSKYQVTFGKHYATKEEYDLRLRAYAVCLFFISNFDACVPISFLCMVITDVYGEDQEAEYCT